MYLDDLTIRPIAEVGDVSSEREDARKDDDLPDLLERFLHADIAVFATPVYWAGVSAQLKCFIDRFSCYFTRPSHAQRFKGKGYVVLCTFASDEPDHGKWVTEPLKFCVDFLGGRYLGDLCVSVYEKGAIRQMTDALQAAYQLGRDTVSKMERESP